MKLNTKLIQGLTDIENLAIDRRTGLIDSPNRFIEKVKIATNKLIQGCDEYENEERDTELSHEDDERDKSKEALE